MNLTSLAFGVLLSLSTMAFSAEKPRPAKQDDPESVRKEITAAYAKWGKARLAFDKAVFEEMLTPDFYVVLGGNRKTRDEFLAMISAKQEGVTLVRFDSRVLTLNKADDHWIAVITEKMEIERKAPDGKSQRAFALWVTRDGFKHVDGKLVFMFSEAIGNEAWIRGQTPPFDDWAKP